LRQWLRSAANGPRVIAQAESVPVGGSLVFQYPKDGDPCILIRPAADTYLAFSRLCTHNSCPIFYRHDLNEFICPCHNGVFSAADGSVLQGPPPRPLPRIQLERRGSEIVATGLAQS
jgi:Rieske Fe-S protein